MSGIESISIRKSGVRRFKSFKRFTFTMFTDDSKCFSIGSG